MLEDILARLPELSNRATLSPGAQASFDAIAGTRGSVRGPFAMLLHSPELAARAAHLGAYIRFGSQLPDAERELAIITTARNFDCDYEWAAHARIANDVGVSEEAIDIVANGKPVSGLCDDYAVIVQFARELLDQHRVSDDGFAAVKKRFGESGAIELTATVGYYSMIACVLNATEMESPAGSPKLP
ncbi:MAG TPA: carboxymuconolactone decarboxylase family protein [Dehalococcoidia bacterium]|nr:carboxymuconolactone decarboxylase family protein [Dehalococcoidia bacterium]